MTDMQERAVNSPKLAMAAVVVLPGPANVDSEAPSVARAGNDVCIINHEFPHNGAPQPDVFLSRSTNKGNTFAPTPRINLSNSAGFSGGEAIAMSRSGNNTRVYVAWNEDGIVTFRRDKTNNGSFSPTIPLSTVLGGNNVDQIRIAADGDNVFVVWAAEHPNLNDNRDIFLASSTNSGDTFQATINVSNNPGKSEDPQVVALGGHDVLVTWRDESSGNYRVHTIRT